MASHDAEGEREDGPGLRGFSSGQGTGLIFTDFQGSEDSKTQEVQASVTPVPISSNEAGPPGSRVPGDSDTEVPCDHPSVTFCVLCGWTILIGVKFDTLCSEPLRYLQMLLGEARGQSLPI